MEASSAGSRRLESLQPTGATATSACGTTAATRTASGRVSARTKVIRRPMCLDARLMTGPVRNGRGPARHSDNAWSATTRGELNASPQRRTPAASLHAARDMLLSRQDLGGSGTSGRWLGARRHFSNSSNRTGVTMRAVCFEGKEDCRSRPCRTRSSSIRATRSSR